MRREFSVSGGSFLAVLVALAILVAPGGAHASKFNLLYEFSGGTDGGNPYAGLIADKAGDLFGTAMTRGGTGCGGGGCGTVFRLSPGGTLTVLHAFSYGANNDGAFPTAGLITDKAGNLYGTTTEGGTDNWGTVFEIASQRSAETVLYSFTGEDDGGYPFAGLLADKVGNLYGEAESGQDVRVHAAPAIANGAGRRGITPDVDGTVFRLAPGGVLTVLHNFGLQNDGFYPIGGLIANRKDDLIGTTANGGAGSGLQGGTVFKVKPDGKETVLYSFCSQKNCADGAAPESGVIADRAGNLYGTTDSGGGTGCGGSGCGTVFRLAPDGTETVLHSFTGDDGFAPNAGLIMDQAGDLFGTTLLGGKNNEGTIFEVAADGTESVLHSFCGHADCTDGANPLDVLLMDKAGNLYGTTAFGGEGSCAFSSYSGCGTVFRLTVK